VAGRAVRSLHQRLVCAGGERAAPVRLLEAQRTPRIPGLVERDEGHRALAGPFRVDGIRSRRAALLRRTQPADARVELVLGETEAGIDPVSDVNGTGRAPAGRRLLLHVGVAVDHVHEIAPLE